MAAGVSRRKDIPNGRLERNSGNSKIHQFLVEDSPSGNHDSTWMRWRRSASFGKAHITEMIVAINSRVYRNAVVLHSKCASSVRSIEFIPGTSLMWTSKGCAQRRTSVRRCVNVSMSNLCFPYTLRVSERLWEIIYFCDCNHTFGYNIQYTCTI